MTAFSIIILFAPISTEPTSIYFHEPGGALFEIATDWTSMEQSFSASTPRLHQLTDILSGSVREEV